MRCRQLLILLPLVAIPLGCLGNRAAKTASSAPENVESVAAASDARTDKSEDESAPFWQNSWLDRLKRAPRIPLPLTGSESEDNVASGPYQQLDEVEL